MSNFSLENIDVCNDTDSLINENTLESSPNMSSIILSKSLVNNQNNSDNESDNSNGSDNSNNSNSSDNSNDYNTSDDSDNSSILSDGSDHIDKTKGDYNLGVFLNGKYILIEKIGYGTFSAVWLAYKFNDNTNKNFYAIKVQHPEDYDDGLKESKYLEKLKTLNCPYIINMYESFTYIDPNSKTKKPSICMVFDLLVGSTYQLIKRGKYENGLDEKIVVKIIKQISEALNIIKKNFNNRNNLK